MRKLDVLVKSEGSVPAPFPWHVLMSRRLLLWLICVLVSEGNNIHLYHQSTMAQQKSAQTSIYVDATLGIMHCRVLEVLQVSLTSHHLKSIAKCFIQAGGSRMVSTSVNAVLDLQLSQSRSEMYNRFVSTIVQQKCTQTSMKNIFQKCRGM